MSFHFIPVSASTITEADVRAFQKAVSDIDGPVFAHCKSGARAASLHAIGEVLDRRLAPQDLPDLGKNWGVDLSLATKWLARDAERRPRVKGFFDPRTFSVQYVVSDPATGQCAIIDPVLDLDEKSGSVATSSADAILRYVAEEKLIVQWLLDTHPHADHLSAIHYLHGQTGAPTAIGARVVDVQRLWQSIYNWPELKTDGSQWDHLFEDGERFAIGTIDATILFSPGHTLGSITYLIGDAAFVHDTIFMPDSGTARTDFPGGSAAQLWDSLRAILALPDETRLFTGHDYQPAGRAPRWESTVGEQTAHNEHVAGVSKAAFIMARDATRPRPADAEADFARATGQRCGRPAAGAREQRPALFQNTDRRFGGCRLGALIARLVVGTSLTRYIGADGLVAQLDRALPSEGRGRRFESFRVRQSVRQIRR